MLYLRSVTVNESLVTVCNNDAAAHLVAIEEPVSFNQRIV